MHELEMMSNCQWFGASWKWNWEQQNSEIEKMKELVQNLSTSCRGSPDLEFSAKVVKQKSVAYQLNQLQLQTLNCTVH